MRWTQLDSFFQFGDSRCHRSAIAPSLTEISARYQRIPRASESPSAEVNDGPGEGGGKMERTSRRGYERAFRRGAIERSSAVSASVYAPMHQRRQFLGVARNGEGGG